MKKSLGILVICIFSLHASPGHDASIEKLNRKIERINKYCKILNRLRQCIPQPILTLDLVEIPLIERDNIKILPDHTIEKMLHIRNKSADECYEYLEQVHIYLRHVIKQTDPRENIIMRRHSC